MKKIGIIFSLTILLYSCSTSKLFIPTQATVDGVKTKYPNITLAELNKGKALYEQKCTICHGIKTPQSRTEEQWTPIVYEMTQMANKDEIKIKPAEEEAILKYLISMSSTFNKKK